MILGKHSTVAKTGSNIDAHVTIGNYTSVGTHVQMLTRYDHACIENPSSVSTFQFSNYPSPGVRDEISIGSDVWIGRNATILGGVSIGHGAIIGAFSVVASNVLPYSIMVGNPAEAIRYRFTSDQIEKLLKIKWWNWEDSKVQGSIDDFTDIDTFLNKHSI